MGIVDFQGVLFSCQSYLVAFSVYHDRGKSIAELAALVRRCSLLHTLNLEWNSFGHSDLEFRNVRKGYTLS